ncbi:hypothetical protein T12_13255 [Trichinella patagoniensis]|uniref:Uncharacterized protein n=1 Tax=Trichinella patagoniensis TaxID=990121 RepID=A0A0V1A2W6_9BILA|nr:hypothetical protein T12_13255 [Trichinella patagoniensis]
MRDKMVCYDMLMLTIQQKLLTREKSPLQKGNVIQMISKQYLKNKKFEKPKQRREEKGLLTRQRRQTRICGAFLVAGEGCRPNAAVLLCPSLNNAINPANHGNSQDVV